MKSTLSLTLDMTVVSKGISDVERSLTQIGITAKATSESVQSLWDVFKDTAAIGASFTTFNQSLQNISQGVQSLTQDFVSFDDAMRKTNTMAGKDAAGFDVLKEQVIDLSKEIPIAREALAEGLYQTISNGVPEDNWIEYLRASSRSAIGGVADLGKVVNVTSTMIKNYGLEWSAAEAIQDKIQMTAKNGVTSFEQLSEALPRVAANAATLGVSVDELMATFATLTGVSGNTAEVSTQLAAVFTALIKPSSEATQIATQMGIKFDAAAVQAAGGFQNFVANLREAVTAFSQTSGMLEQEVYGKLFGSAQSLRALVPLTGELADKYVENVNAMKDATGEMASAYEMNAGSVTSQNQKIKNSFAAAMDGVGEFLSTYRPITELAAMTSSVVISVGGLVMMLSRLTKATLMTTAGKKVLCTSIKVLCPNVKALTVSFSMLTRTQKACAIGATALKVALRGALIATGVGAAIWALSAIIDAFSSSADEATDSTNQLTEAQRAQRTVAEAQAAATEAGKAAEVQAKMQIEEHIKAIKNFNGSATEQRKLLSELEGAYGTLMGSHATLSQWYDTLIANSRSYCDQMLKEARVAKYKDKIIEAEAAFEAKWGKHGHTYVQGKTQQIYRGQAEKYRSEAKSIDNENFDPYSWNGRDKEKSKKSRALNGKADIWDGIVADAQALDELYGKLEEQVNLKIDFKTGGGGKQSTGQSGKASEMSITELTAQKSLLEKQLQDSKPGDDVADKVKEYKQITKAIDARNKKLGLGNKKTGSGNNKKKVVEGDNLSREQLNTNIELYTKKLTSEDTAEQKMIREKIKGWRDAVDAIDIAAKAAQRPQSLDTLKDISAEIEYQRFMRERASGEAIAGYDAEIKRLQQLAKAMELQGVVSRPIDQITTYEELNEEMSRCSEAMQTATADERTQIQQRINALNDLKAKWDEVLQLVDTPADIDSLSDPKDIKKAIQYYQAKAQNATGSDYTDAQRNVNGLNKKLEAGQRGGRMLEIESMLTDLNALTGKNYAIELQAIGLDSILEQIRELQKMLSDTEHPLDDLDRAFAEGLISDLNTLKDDKAFGGLTKEAKQAWEGVEGLGSAFSGLGSALELPAIDFVGTLAQAIATMVLSYSTAMSQASTMGPIAWAAFAAAGLAQLTAVITSVKSVAKFADGGIAYGPTLGLFGEYAGAASNPEVVAPLNKLKSLIEPREAAVVAGHVEFDIDGRKLHGVLRKVQTLSNRS